MNKWIKGIIIAAFICAAIYLVPCFMLWNLFLNLPNSRPVNMITDHSLMDEKTYKVEKANMEVRIPAYYNSCQEIKEYSSFFCEARTKNKELLIVYQPFNQIADKIMPGFSNTYDDMMANFYQADLPFPLSLTHSFPNDVYDAMKEVYQTDKNDYNFWNLSESLYIYYCLSARAEVEEKETIKVCSMYERDNIRAVIATNPNDPGNYVIMIFPDSNTGNIYAMVIQTSDTDDITKLLNTYEFK